MFDIKMLAVQDPILGGPMQHVLSTYEDDAFWVTQEEFDELADAIPRVVLDSEFIGIQVNVDDDPDIAARRDRRRHREGASAVIGLAAILEALAG